MTEEEARDELINSLTAAGLRFDYYILSSGVRMEDGTIEPTNPYTTIPRRYFLTEYKNVAHDDMAALQFSMNPLMPIRVSQSEYANSRATGQEIGRFLLESEIAHLLLTGVDSSYGLAWITLYRSPGKESFTDTDAEIARYVGQSGVFQWQQRIIAGGLKHPPPPLRYRMLDLRPRLLEYLFWKGRGYSHEDMGDSSSLMSSSINDLSRDLSKCLNDSEPPLAELNPKYLMEQYLGKLPKWRPKR